MPNRIIFPADLAISDIIKLLKKYSRPSDIETVMLAYELANRAHAGQLRKSGEPYINHLLGTAYILATMKFDAQLVIAGLLHDVPEDTNITIEEIERDFGADIASMIRGVTKLGKLKYRGVERYIENLRKLFVAMAEDVRVMIIKFADRIHNLSTLQYLEPSKQRRVALESLEIYAAIANRLGMGEFKALLEDLAFPYVYPKEYEKTQEIRNQLIADGEGYIERVIEVLKNELADSGIHFIDIHGRKKQLYSFYQKLIKKDWQTNRIYDIIALRVIVPEIADCYATLGIIHKLWKPLKGRIKDYTAQPKPNGYKSLHTTVFCINGYTVEFQIRTKEMHNEAEFGAAAHWHYDESGIRMPAKEIIWAKELADIQQDILNNMSDLEDLKLDFFKNRIFTFTPKGDVIDLPEEATPVDFAYHIHSEIGNHCVSARVNDTIVDLAAPLHSGDVVEIVVDKNKKSASAEWLKFVKTQLAKSHIKASVKAHSLKTLLKNFLPAIKKSNG